MTTTETTVSLWDYEDPIHEYEGGEDIDIPDWIDEDISPSTVAAIIQGGCASGAYMPAVTYHEAAETMNEHGDAVLQFLEDYGAGETLDTEAILRESWAGVACYFLSAAVETWALVIEDELSELLADDNEDDDGMSEDQVLDLWREEIRPAIVARYGENDLPALREGFNDWTDGLCKDGEISEELYESIECPD